MAMMGRVRLKSKILPGSPAMEGIATSALVTAAMTAGFTDLGSSTLLLDGKKRETRDAGKTVSHGLGGARGSACRSKEARGALEGGGLERYTARMNRSRLLPGRANVVRAGSRPIRSSDARARRRKSGQRRERHRFSPDAPELGHGGDGGGAGAHGLARGRDLGAREEAALDSRDSRHRCWRLRVRV